MPLKFGFIVVFYNVQHYSWKWLCRIDVLFEKLDVNRWAAFLME